MSEPLVEEIMRYDPPLHLFTRWVYEDTEIEGVTLKRGTQIACLLGAANRDPAAYPDPHVFDPNRGSKSHVAFGAGLHFCVGAPLARLELRIGLEELMRKPLQLAEPPRYGNTYHFHGLEALMVTR